MPSKPSEARIQASMIVQAVLQEAGTLDLTPEDWTERLEFALESAREEGREEVYALTKRMLSRHVSKEGRTVLGQLCGRLKARWPGINRRLPSPPPGEGGGG